MGPDEQTDESLTLEYGATSSPWLNLGIVGLFRFLERHEGTFGEIEGEPSNFTLEIRDVDNISEFVNQAIELLYMRETGNQGYFYDSSSKEFKAYPKKNFDGISRYYWGKVQQRFEDKVGVDDLRERGVEIPDGVRGKTVGTSPPKVSVKVRDDFDDNPRTANCSYCGSNLKTWNVRKLEHPIGSSPGRFLNFKPDLKGDERICASCSLASVFAMSEAVSNLTYERGTAYHVIIIPDIRNLRELYQLQGVIKTPTDNIPDPDEYFRGTWIKRAHEFLLHFLIGLEELLERMEEGGEVSSVEELTTSTLVGGGEELKQNPVPRNVLVIEGQGDRFTRLLPYSKNHEVIRLIYQLNGELATERELTMKKLFNSLPVIQNRKILPHRDEFSRAFLHFQPLINPLKKISDEKGYIYGSLTFLRAYQRDVIGMKESIINQCYAIGGKIGGYCRKHNYTRPITDLRNVNNHPQLIRVLRGIQYQVPDIFLNRELIKSMHEERPDHIANLISLAANQARTREVKKD